ncbi:MAG: hypothetical protein EOP86_02260 [Verrucomicrobiaceae bacterium]|nr:MAG: hypothetical protein EOP86_02260 [Verrucomicrobiaceae bacterium]
MLAINDPYALKPPDVYRQARTVASKTSRGSDGNWYREPGDIGFQWHLWFDGGQEVCSATLSCDDRRWRPGPSLPLASLTTGEGVNEVLGELLSPTYFGVRPKALGVILHVADEFTLAEVAPAADSAAEAGNDFNFLRYNLVDSPRQVLADRDVSEDLTSWRLLPFWGSPPDQPASVAVALPRVREAFLKILVEKGEEWAVPIRVAVTSGPLEALAALCVLQPDSPHGTLVAVPYLKFTAVFALSGKGELRAARSLPHRSGSPVPAGMGQILWNMALSEELAGGEGDAQRPPQVLIVSGNAMVLKEASRELDTYSATRKKILYRTMDLSGHPALDQFPGHRPEFLVYDPSAVEQFSAKPPPNGETLTFKALWSGWSTQSFFDTGKLDALYPTRGDLRLLGFSKALVFLLVLSMVGLGGSAMYSFFKAMNHPSWAMTPAALKAIEDKNIKLLAERRQIESTQRLLQARSQGWSAMEFMLQLFPEDAGTRMESFTYSVESARTAPPAKKGVIPETAGMSREWAFKGLAKARTLVLLNNINSQRGLAGFFSQVAQATGDASFTVEPTRQMTISLTQGRNPRFIAESASPEAARDPSIAYPYFFEVTISQSFSEADALALPTVNPL